MELQKIQYITDYEYITHSGGVIKTKRTVGAWIEPKDIDLYKDKGLYGETDHVRFVITKLNTNATENA